MKPNFVETKNFKRFITNLDAVTKRHVPEANMLVMTGYPGIGKTHILNWYAVHNAAIMIRLTAATTPHWVLTDILRGLGEPSQHSCEKMYNTIVAKLKKTPRPIVVDEIEHAMGNIKVLETVRDVGDACELPAVILAGREYVASKIERHKHFHTRITRYVDVKKLGADEVRKVCLELAEVELADDVIDHIADICEGHIREVLKAITEVERLAKSANVKRVSMAEIKGEFLLPNMTAEAA